MVMPSIEFLKLGPFTYEFNSFLFWNNLTPRPLPALLCLVINGLEKCFVAFNICSLLLQ